MIFHCIQHVWFEGPGYFKTWAEKNGHSFNFTLQFENHKLPTVDDFDVLVVMGGPMSFDEEHIYPWILPEIDLIRNAIQANKAVIGICLGAQFIVRALGGTAKHGREKEIGWDPEVQFSDKGKADAGFDFLPEKLKVLHWHADTFDIPERAIHLASTKEFPNQMFLYKSNVLGIQFHFEVDASMVKQFVEQSAGELKEVSRYIQSAAGILLEKDAYAVNHHLLDQILQRMLSSKQYE